MTTTQDAVNQLVSLFADIEGLADQANTKLNQMPALFQTINTNGDAGALITTAFSMRAKALGMSFKAGVLDLHSDSTEAAKLRGIDIPPPPSGGGR